MEQLEKYDEYLKEHLSQKRYTHSKNVSDASVMLAKKFGYPDVEKARFAGWCMTSARKSRRMCSTR